MKSKSGYSLHTEVRIGVDPVIAKNDAADYTAMVPGLLYEVEDGYRLYIFPKVINKRMDFPETVEMCKVLDKSYSEDGSSPAFVIEDVGYQRALSQQLLAEGLWNVKTTRLGNQDKRSRLVLTSNSIKSGRVLSSKRRG